MNQIAINLKHISRNLQIPIINPHNLLKPQTTLHYLKNAFLLPN